MDAITDEAIHGHASDDEPHRLRAVVSYLSSSLRGRTIKLEEDEVTIGSSLTADIHMPPDSSPLPDPIHARLHRRGQSYQLVAEPDALVFVNGDAVEELVLASGDVLEIGPEGPVIRFRLWPVERAPHKSVPEVFSDCLECVKRERPSRVGRAVAMTRHMPFALVTQTSVAFRIGMITISLLLMTAVASLALHSRRLEQRLAREAMRVEGLAGLLADGQSQAPPDAQGMAELLAELRGGLSNAQALDERLAALESNRGDFRGVIQRATAATLFLQGSYGFTDPDSGRPLRVVLGPGGTPMRNLQGDPRLTLEGDGPPLEIFYTGTGFVASPDGLVVTNRHVAIPWEFDEAARRLVEAGLVPVMFRFLGYFPGRTAPLDLTLVSASDEGDLALLRGEFDLGPGRPGMDSLGGPPRSDGPGGPGAGQAGDQEAAPPLEPRTLAYLPIAEAPPTPGEAVLVMGYPLGLRALMARTDPGFVESIQEDAESDFWNVAQRLSEAGHVSPLASRGIVSQVNLDVIVYDAETTSGGSGGPVLNTRGEVVAVNAAILPEFGGSNLGVPGAKARRLLDGG